LFCERWILALLKIKINASHCHLGATTLASGQSMQYLRLK
jgi:hypothetical protein